MDRPTPVVDPALLGGAAVATSAVAGNGHGPARPATAASSLAAEGLTLAYDDRVISEGLSVVIPDGQVSVIVGANACGKSTLLRGLARLLRPRAGAVLLDGHDIRRLPAK